ncbi:LysR family transcriptional regulator [Roseomonas sp. PWR1]|uniref:LysR family transcriptional regulator n=1 Tax=Roseomonas nitratireducens TaxID=2820810 RepID=A0ABS4AQM3_9PROT|nr:LysR family transcriptional regulator [Neoroseomonas nitratireducens]MBP0462867.1 LysR family transcriptional regulator [Neoroseomonas nitratireducens]
MNWLVPPFDWTLARAFLATAETGSLSAAARMLGQAQPTIGRQVAALERRLGIVLFERVGRGLALTPTGREVLEHVRAMGEAAGRVSLVAAGRSQAIEGPIRITASEVYAAHLLPPIIARLRETHPGITVEIIATNRPADLLRREADIAVRNFESRDAELIVRKVADDRARAYATPECLRRLGRPRRWADLAEAPFVGFDRTELLIEGMRALGLHLTRRNFPVQADSHLVHWALVRQGLGIGLITEALGEAEPAVLRVLREEPPLTFPIWLATHRELHMSVRVRLVFDLLADALSASRR